jgi:hypothetical protein
MAKKLIKPPKPAPRAETQKWTKNLPDYVKCSFEKLVKPAELKPNPNNPNRHTRAQIERFAEILKFTGVRKPVVVSNQSGMIVTGHGTLQAIQENGWEFAPVDYQDFESYDQEYAHIVADNELQKWSEIDKGAVNAQLENLGPDLNLAMFGFQNFVMDLATESVGAPPPAGTEESNWEDPVQSETVRKIVLFYSAERYAVVMKSLMELSQKRGVNNLSDLISELIERANQE